MSGAVAKEPGRPGDRFGGVLHEARPFRTAFARLLSLLLLSSVLESVGLALVPTVLTVLMSDQAASKVPSVLQPLLHLLPPSGMALAVTGAVAVLFVLKHTVSLVTIGYSTTIVNRMRDAWRSRIIDRYLNAPLGETRAEQSGKLIENLVNQPIRAAKFMRFIIGMCADSVSSAAMLVVLVVASWKVTLVVGGFFVVIAVIGTLPLKRHAGRLGARENKMLHQLTHMATEAISGLQQIKIFGLERRWHGQFMDASHAHSANSLYTSLLSESPNLIGAFALAAMIVGVVAYSIDESRDGLSMVVLFVLVGQRLHGDVSGMMRNYTNMRNLKPSFDMVRALADWTPPPAYHRDQYESPLKSIQFDRVCFAYDGRPPLMRDMSFTIEPGKITALVGPSGSGKSTLVNLLCGLLTPTGGRILVNDRPLSDFDPASWLRRIGIVSQDNFLFHGSIASNLQVGRASADAAEMTAAVREAGAEEFITRLPQAFDTIVGERGATLSGGQVQRLAIARALLRDGDLMIFDEATSALDHASQAHVLKTLRALADSGKAVLVISHRLEALSDVDSRITLGTDTTQPQT